MICAISESLRLDGVGHRRGCDHTVLKQSAGPADERCRERESPWKEAGEPQASSLAKEASSQNSAEHIVIY